MRLFIAAAAIFAAIALTGCATTPVAPVNPFEIKADAYNRGMVIIALDNPPDGYPERHLTLYRFDPVQKKLSWPTDAAEKKVYPSPYVSDFKLVTDDAGHDFLVSSMAEGEVVIHSFYSQNYWGMYYNADTYRFFVKGGAYTFVGRFNDQPSYKILNDAIAAGKLPASIPEGGFGGFLYDQTLIGFTPGTERPADKDLVAAMVAKAMGHPVDIVTPELTRTEVVMVRPASATPPTVSVLDSPMAPVPPVTDSIAKPASATAWVARPVP